MADCDVLICGLGPVGLLALLLDDLGVSVIAFDKASEPYGLPRAAVVDDEVMRIFQAAGVDREVMGAAQVAPVVSLPIAGGGRRRCSASATASSGTRRSCLSTSRRSSA